MDNAKGNGWALFGAFLGGFVSAWARQHERQREIAEQSERRRRLPPVLDCPEGREVIAMLEMAARYVPYNVIEERIRDYAKQNRGRLIAAADEIEESHRELYRDPVALKEVGHILHLLSVPKRALDIAREVAARAPEEKAKETPQEYITRRVQHEERTAAHQTAVVEARMRAALQARMRILEVLENADIDADTRDQLEAQLQELISRLLAGNGNNHGAATNGAKTL